MIISFLFLLLIATNYFRCASHLTNGVDDFVSVSVSYILKVVLSIFFSPILLRVFVLCLNYHLSINRTTTGQLGKSCAGVVRMMFLRMLIGLASPSPPPPASVQHAFHLGSVLLRWPKIYFDHGLNTAGKFRSPSRNATTKFFPPRLHLTSSSCMYGKEGTRDGVRKAGEAGTCEKNARKLATELDKLLRHPSVL